MKRRFIAISMLLCLFYLATVNAAWADTLRLKNGTVVKGKVVSFSGGSFTVALDLGTSSQSRAIIDMRDVESIEFDGRSDDRGSNTARETAPTRDAVPRPSAPDDDTGHRANTTTPTTTQPTRPTNSPTTGPATTPTSPSGTLSASNAKEVVAVVPAKDDWTYANIVVRRGDRIRLTASGKVKISSSREVGPEGADLDDKEKLIRNRPTGSLIAVIGDDNDDFIYVGRDGEFVAARDGKLFLSVNEGDLSDNSGSFNVRVKVDANR